MTDKQVWRKVAAKILNGDPARFSFAAMVNVGMDQYIRLLDHCERCITLSDTEGFRGRTDAEADEIRALALLLFAAGMDTRTVTP